MTFIMFLHKQKRNTSLKWASLPSFSPSNPKRYKYSETPLSLPEAVGWRDTPLTIQVAFSFRTWGLGNSHQYLGQNFLLTPYLACAYHSQAGPATGTILKPPLSALLFSLLAFNFFPTHPSSVFFPPDTVFSSLSLSCQQISGGITWWIPFISFSSITF